MVYEYFKDKIYCSEHKVTFLKGSICNQCPISPNETKVVKHNSMLKGNPSLKVPDGIILKGEVQSTLTNNSLTNTNNSRRVYVRKNIVERFHAYRVKFEAEVLWEHLFSYEEFTLNNNVKFKRIDYPEAIVRVFRKSILVTIRSSKEVKGLPVKEAQRISNDLILSVLQKLPKAIQIKESKLSSVHNAFINHPLAKRDIKVIDKNDEVRFISDNSHGNPEFEAINTNHAISDSEVIEQDIISLVDKGLSRDYIASALNELIKDRYFHAENMRTHVQAIQDLSKGVNELREQIKLKSKLDFISRFK